MEQQSPKTGTFALRYGLLLAGIGLVFQLMLYSMNMHYQRNWVLGIIGLLIMVAFISIGIFQYKKANSGILSLGQALKVGVGISLVSGIIAILYQYILASFIDPEFVQKTLEFQANKALEAGKINAEQFRQQIDMGKKFFWMGYPIGLIITILIGLIISLIAGLIMKKSPKAY